MRRDEQQLSVSVFTLVLSISLWLAAGSLVLGIADGGSHPLWRALVGTVLVALTASALWQRWRLCRCLQAHPWLVMPIALAQLSAAAVDGLLPSGPYLAFSMTSIALAVLVARPRTVWSTVALLELSYGVAILAERSPAQIVESGYMSGVLGAVLGFPFAALLGLGVLWLFRRAVSDVEPTLQSMRDGAPALTPALTLAIERGPVAPAQLPAPGAAELTPTERRVVEGLARGNTPKELAFGWGVSIATVRTHIRHAKRKTGARTLAELVGMATGHGTRQGPRS